MPAITDSVQFVKGIGPKKVKLFEKLHISTLQDALETYPRDYEDRTQITRIADIADEDRYAVRAILGTEPKVSRIRKGMTLVKCTIFDESGSLGVTWFNQPYITAQLRVGQEYLFYGRVQGFGRARQMISPQAEKVAENDRNPGRIVPVYPLTAGLTQRDMARVTEAALDAVPGDWPDPLPEVLRVKYRLPDAADALAAIHRPKTREDVNEARRRMVFEELFLLCCGLQQLKERRRADSGILFRGDRLEEFFAALPFAPTGAQRRAIMEIAADCASGRPMNRLVQGDVGSGKTVVAAALCALAAQNGWQAAFMAPTEILAAQHAETLSPMLSKLGLTCTLLTERRGRHARPHPAERRFSPSRRGNCGRAAPFRRRTACSAVRQGRDAARARHVRDTYPAHARADHVRRPRCIHSGRDAARQKSGRDLRGRGEYAPPHHRLHREAARRRRTGLCSLSSRRGRGRGQQAQKRRAAREGSSGAAAAPPRSSTAWTYEKRRKRRSNA